MTWITKTEKLTVSTLMLFAIVTGSGAASAHAGSAHAVVSAPQTIALKFKVPDRGAPPTTAGGATRGSCVRGSKLLTPLVPQGNLGLTVAARPGFFLYVPHSSAKTADLLLLSDDDTEVVYQAAFALPTTAGIVRFNLPETAPALQVGKRYHWYLTLACDSIAGANGNPTAEGWVERTEPTPALKKALAKAQQSSRPELYAASGIWHETLTTLADLRRKSPGNPALLANWKELLQSVGLSTIANEPLVGQ